jgi:hypothetical protein
LQGIPEGREVAVESEMLTQAFECVAGVGGKGGPDVVAAAAV